MTVNKKATRGVPSVNKTSKELPLTTVDEAKDEVKELVDFLIKQIAEGKFEIALHGYIIDITKMARNF